MTRFVNHLDCKKARVMLDVSQSKMSLLLGVSDGRSVRRWESGPKAESYRPAMGVTATLYLLILKGKVTKADLSKL